MIHWLFYSGLILRITGAAMLSFLLVILLGPRMIRVLLRYKLGDRPEFDHADLNELTRHKSNTPTMGGVLIVVSILTSVLLFADLSNMYIRIALLALVWLGGLGGVDDWIKLRRAAGKSSRDGLKMWEKMVFQIGLVVIIAVPMYVYGRDSGIGQSMNPAHTFYFPFKASPVALPLLAYIIIAVVTMVGSSNAVNLTDGMDGLASGLMIIVSGVFLLIAWISGVEVWAASFNFSFVPGSHEMTILCAAMIGSCLGFLWYNAHPAQVFMGDTGSLALGGLLGYVAVVTRQELLLAIAGGVFVMEAASVILQVGFFKLTKRNGMPGRRLLRCAPVHHHFHLSGWAETKVVMRFWILGAVLAAIALATIKLR